MFHASPMIAAAPWAPESLVVDAVRCWREAIDRQRPVLPTLFARLETHHAGFLAPAIAALLAVHEAWLGQRFRAGEPARADLTEDERRLFTLLETNALPAREKAANPGLAGPLQCPHLMRRGSGSGFRLSRPWVGHNSSFQTRTVTLR